MSNINIHHTSGFNFYGTKEDAKKINNKEASTEEEKIKNIIAKKSKEISEFTDLESMFDSNSQYSNRVAFNEAIYNEIFLMSNKLLNNDSNYDILIDQYSKDFEKTFIMYIINIYYERLVKIIKEILLYSDDQAIRYESRGMMPISSSEARKRRIKEAINIYGADDLIASLIEVLNGRQIKELKRVVDSVMNPEYFPQNNVSQTIKEVITIIKECGATTTEKAYFTKEIRNSASHGEYEIPQDDDEYIIIRNNGNLVQIPSDSSYDIYRSSEDPQAFSINGLRNLASTMLEKILKDNLLEKQSERLLFHPKNRDTAAHINSYAKEEREYFRIMKELYEAVRNRTLSQYLENKTNEEKNHLMIIISKISLFSFVQYNTEHYFRDILEMQDSTNYPDVNENTHFINGSLFIQPGNFDYDRIDEHGKKREIKEEDVDIIRLERKDDKIFVTGALEDIKNAIGHDNIKYIHTTLICNNYYSKYKPNSSSDNSNYDFNGSDYAEISGGVITFKESDWFATMARKDFFYAIARTPEEQKKIIEEGKKRRH